MRVHNQTGMMTSLRAVCDECGEPEDVVVEFSSLPGDPTVFLCGVCLNKALEAVSEVFRSMPVIREVPNE